MKKIIGYIIISDGAGQVAYDWPDVKGGLAQWGGRVTMFPSRRTAYAYMKRAADYGDKMGWPVWQKIRYSSVLAVYRLGVK
jgi:hypothetical protein